MRSLEGMDTDELEQMMPVRDYLVQTHRRNLSLGDGRLF